MTEDEFRARVTAEMACHDCTAEVRVTFGASVYARVIHTAACPWLPRYLARELSQRTDYTGAIPCGVRNVTHRGPYKRDPGQGETADAFPQRPQIAPVRQPKPCHVPGCEEDADLYPAGWLCDDHRPGRQAAAGSAP